jgi:hypothetical protein
LPSGPAEAWLIVETECSNGPGATVTGRSPCSSIRVWSSLTSWEAFIPSSCRNRPDTQTYGTLYQSPWRGTPRVGERAVRDSSLRPKTERTLCTGQQNICKLLQQRTAATYPVANLETTYLASKPVKLSVAHQTTRASPRGACVPTRIRTGCPRNRSEP